MKLQGTASSKIAKMNSKGPAALPGTGQTTAKAANSATSSSTQSNMVRAYVPASSSSVSKSKSSSNDSNSASRKGVSASASKSAEPVVRRMGSDHSVALGEIFAAVNAQKRQIAELKGVHMLPYLCSLSWRSSVVHSLSRLSYVVFSWSGFRP